MTYQDKKFVENFYRKFSYPFCAFLNIQAVWKSEAKQLEYFLKEMVERKITVPNYIKFDPSNNWKSVIKRNPLMFAPGAIVIGAAWVSSALEGRKRCNDFYILFPLQLGIIGVSNLIGIVPYNSSARDTFDKLMDIKHSRPMLRTLARRVVGYYVFASVYFLGIVAMHTFTLGGPIVR